MSADQSMTCSVCGAPASRSTLATFGARCLGCFAAFCREPVFSRWPKPLDLPDERIPRSWAHRLKAREKSGEVLSPAQAAAWREALRYHLTTTEELTS